MVQSYLEGVGWGLEQLREARAELKEVSQALKKAGLESSQNTEGVKSLERLREVSVNHRQLLAAVSNLPRLYSGVVPLCGHTGLKSVIHHESSFLFNLQKLVFIFLFVVHRRRYVLMSSRVQFAAHFYHNCICFNPTMRL